MEDSHPVGLRRRLVELWIGLSGLGSVRGAARLLGCSHPAVSYWMTGAQEPSSAHMASMAGYYAEGGGGLMWASNPVLHMSGHAAYVGGVSRDRALALAVCRDRYDRAPHKQALWRLFELCLLTTSGYPLNTVEHIDWAQRQTIAQKPVRPKPIGNIWLPPDPLHLVCPVPVNAPQLDENLDLGRSKPIATGNAGYRLPRKPVSLW